MLITFEDLFPTPGVLPALRQHAQPNQHIYLVGGCIRDLLLGTKSHDLDLTLSGDAVRLARQVANQLNAGFFVLDDSRKTARVIVQNAQGKNTFLDFAAQRGFRIEDDLRGRDFTINSMAIDIRQPERIIDPLNGGRDLGKKILRLCSPQAFADDPVRILRAVRFSTSLGLRIEPATLSQLRAAVEDLEAVSAERKRDELFRMLDSRWVYTGLSLLDRLDVLGKLFPEIAAMKNVDQSAPHTQPVWEHTLETIRRLEELYVLLVLGPEFGDRENLILGMTSLSLGRFRKDLQQHYDQPIHSERSLRSLLFLAALLHDIAKPENRTVEADGSIRFLRHEQRGIPLAETIARRLALSNPEIDRLSRMVGGHMRVHQLATASREVSRRSIFRYFRALEAAGVDVCLLSLADTLAKSGVTISSAEWERELLVCRQLLEAWFDKREEWIAPPRLIGGNDIMNRFGLQPGVKIGELLEIVQEAQAAGQIQTREQAFEWLEYWLKHEVKGDERENHGTEDG